MSLFELFNSILKVDYERKIKLTSLKVKWSDYDKVY